MEDWMKNPKAFVKSVSHFNNYFKDIDTFKHQHIKDEDLNDKNFLPHEPAPKNIIN